MIYFDNGATTFKKPKAVYNAVVDTMRYAGGNAGRGGHKLSVEAGNAVYGCRESVCRLFGISDPSRVCFVNNATTALNYAIKGVLNENDHVIISSFEHNSVLRPVYALSQNKNVKFDIIESNQFGVFESVEKHICPETKLIVINHASNVTGNIANIRKIGEIAKKHGILFCVDCSQSAGHIPIDVEKDNIDIFACSGHKSLFGPQGTGILYIKSGLHLDTLMEGGTGSMSELMTQPEILPDRFETGTLNAPGIAGLDAGISYILERGIDDIRNHEIMLVKKLITDLCAIKNVKVYGNLDFAKRVGVVGFNIKNWDSVSLASHLSGTYSIMVRGGLHCAYLAHKTLGTIETGCVRVSFSCFNTENEIRKFIKIIDKIA